MKNSYTIFIILLTITSYLKTSVPATTMSKASSNIYKYLFYDPKITPDDILPNHDIILYNPLINQNFTARIHYDEKNKVYELQYGYPNNLKTSSSIIKDVLQAATLTILETEAKYIQKKLQKILSPKANPTQTTTTTTSTSPLLLTNTSIQLNTGRLYINSDNKTVNFGPLPDGMLDLSKHFSKQFKTLENAQIYAQAFLKENPNI